MFTSFFFCGAQFSYLPRASNPLAPALNTVIQMNARENKIGFIMERSKVTFIEYLKLRLNKKFFNVSVQYAGFIIPTYTDVRTRYGGYTLYNIHLHSLLWLQGRPRSLDPLF